MLPRDTHDGVIVVARMREIHTGIGLVVGILEIVHPAVLVGVDIDDTGVEEIPLAGERACDGLVDDPSLLVDVGGVFRDHDHLVGIDLNIRVAHPVGGVQLVLAQGGRRVVIPLIAEDHLLRVEAALARHGVGVIDALDGSELILVGPFPRDRTAPIQVRGDWLAIAILGDLEEVVASIGRIGQPLANDRITHIINELPILGVCHLCLIHPEGIKRNALPLGHNAPERVLVCRTHLERTTLDQDHPIGGGLIERHRSHSGHLSTTTCTTK